MADAEDVKTAPVKDVTEADKIVVQDKPAAPTDPAANWADRAGIKAPATTSDDYADNRTKDGGMISEHVVQAGLKAMRDKFVEELGHEKMKGRREKVTFKADFGADDHELSAGSSDYEL